MRDDKDLTDDLHKQLEEKIKKISGETEERLLKKIKKQVYRTLGH